MATTVPVLIGVAAALLLGLGALLDDRRARLRRRDQRDPVPVRPLLHSINDDRCIGCEACVDVCPTEVLDLVNHKVRVARFSDCVQCEQCANACPTQALVMYRQGTTPRMLTVPELDEHFQTGVPGQYLIGEVAGKPLVKNAANLGRAVIEHIARTLAAAPAQAGMPGVVDVAIVGSGPGGLSAGLTCIQRKLSCIVLEKEHVMASTVARYPKGKHFMAEPCTARNVSYLPVFDGTKEQLVAAWSKVVEGVGLPIKLGEAVETVKRGDDGIFMVKTTVASYRARTIVLATGLRGKPRLLAVPGANLEKVQSLLDDPAEFAGEDALVVGGGDSAVEGAIALAEVGARVTLSYRGDGFKRCKQGNQKRLAEMTANHRLAVLLESNVKCFTPDAVTIALADKSETTIANQRAFVLIGADTPVAWLETNQVRFVERPHLYALGSSEDVVRRFVPGAAECPHTADEALAIVLGRAQPRASIRRMRSVADHLRDEFREVVTSVSVAFRLSDLEPPDARRATTRTPVRGVAPIRTGTVIPASRPATRRAATDAARAAIRHGLFGDEDTLIGPAPGGAPATAPLRPRSHRRAGTIGNTTASLPAISGEITTDAVPSLRALERAAGLAGTPSARATDEMAALRHSLDEPTDEMTSLRAREHAAEQIAALRRSSPATAAVSPDDGRTEEVASLRAIERSTAEAPPRRRRSTSNSVLTSAPRPPASASAPHAAPDRRALRGAAVLRSATEMAQQAAVPRGRRTVPPPIPARSPRLARGSEAMENRPPSIPEAPAVPVHDDCGVAARRTRSAR